MHRPGTLSEVSERTFSYLSHSNSERPNQARSCGNQPPRVACPAEPSLKSVPETVVTSRWLVQINQQAFARTIRANGRLTINREDSYVSRSLAGKPGHLLGERRREVLRHLAARRTYQVGSNQGLVWKDDAFPGLCGADEARGALRISAGSVHPSQAHPGPTVGPSLQEVAARSDQAPASRVSCS